MVRCARDGRAANARSTLHEDSLELSRRPAHNVAWKECGYTLFGFRAPLLHFVDIPWGQHPTHA